MKQSLQNWSHAAKNWCLFQLPLSVLVSFLDYSIDPNEYVVDGDKRRDNSLCQHHVIKIWQSKSASYAHFPHLLLGTHRLCVKIAP